MKKLKLNVTFVCTGNTCRSPMAEYLFKAYLREKKRSGDFCVNSAGLYAVRGDTLSATAHDALEMLGVKHDPSRRAKPFTVMMAEDSDVIVAMSERHAELCGDGYVLTFERLIGRPMPDPFGGPIGVYLECAAMLRSAFDTLLTVCDGLLAQKRK